MPGEKGALTLRPVEGGGAEVEVVAGDTPRLVLLSTPGREESPSDRYSATWRTHHSLEASPWTPHLPALGLQDMVHSRVLQATLDLGRKMLDEAKIGCVKLTSHKDCINFFAFSFEQQGVSLRDASNMKTS